MAHLVLYFKVNLNIRRPFKSGFILSDFNRYTWKVMCGLLVKVNPLTEACINNMRSKKMNTA